MKDKLESLAQSAKGSVGGGAEAVRDAVGRLSEIGTLSTEAAKGLADDLNELLPAIRRAGYSVTGIDIDVAIPPHIAVHCQLQTEVAETERQALLNSLEGRRLAASAIRALFQVADLQKRLSAGDLKPTDVILDLGVNPGVKVRYR
jgi:hypothetical protein